MNGLLFLKDDDCYDDDDIYLYDDEYLLNNYNYPINTHYSSLLRQLNVNKKINDQTYDEYYKQQLEKLIAFSYFGDLEDIHEETKRLLKEVDIKINAIDKKIKNDDNEFKKSSNSYQILMSKDAPIQ